MKQSLAKVANPEGRLDVLLYQFAGRLMERIEQERGWLGIRENFLPMIEDLIVAAEVPQRNVIPWEVRAVLKVYHQNRRRRP